MPLLYNPQENDFITDEYASSWSQSPPNHSTASNIARRPSATHHAPRPHPPALPTILQGDRYNGTTRAPPPRNPSRDHVTDARASRIVVDATAPTPSQRSLVRTQNSRSPATTSALSTLASADYISGLFDRVTSVLATSQAPTYEERRREVLVALYGAEAPAREARWLQREVNREQRAINWDRDREGNGESEAVGGGDQGGMERSVGRE